MKDNKKKRIQHIISIRCSEEQKQFIIDYEKDKGVNLKKEFLKLVDDLLNKYKPKTNLEDLIGDL